MNRLQCLLGSTIVLLAAGCGDDRGPLLDAGPSVDASPLADAGTRIDAADPRPDAGAALSCRSLALCTAHEVKQFTGGAPLPGGGVIASGLYRRQYTLVPDFLGLTAGYGYGEHVDVLLVRGDSYVRSGTLSVNDGVGTFTTSGTTVTFSMNRGCYHGVDNGPVGRIVEYPYTATDHELRLYSRLVDGNGLEWFKVDVYARVDDPADVCRLAPSEPESPGDSAFCNADRCACAFTLDGTVDECR